MDKKLVVVAMSGGVDSSTTAYLLQKEGYNIVGATMRLIDDEKTEKAINDAKEVCQKLGIKHYVFDLTKEFKEIVINNFIESYKSGQTPNPCVLCNKKFKFGLFYKKAKEELNADYIATGHYAKVENGKLISSNTINKDQSYFLYGIDKEVLKHVIFPLEKYKSKDEVREVARSAGISVSNKKDSQEVCFIPNDDYPKYLEEHMKEKAKPGNIYLEDNTIIGKHHGLIYYTIGQRKGLNISYKEPLYVLEIDTKNNALIVGPNKSLFKTQLLANNINILVDELPSNVLAKIRSRGDKQEAALEKVDDKILVTFKEPVRAITKGQSVVFYDQNNICLGGGIIEKVL